MSKLARHLDDLTVEALSPDGRIRAVVEGRNQPRIHFDDPAQFTMYRDTSTLSTESGTALNRAVSQWRKQHKDAVDKYARANHSGPHWDAGRRRMYTQFEQIQVQGRAPVDLVRVITTGLMSWTVGVRPGALESLSASVFCTAVNAAIQDASRQYYTAMQKLKAKVLVDLDPKR